MTFRPRRTDRRSSFARVLLGGGGIVAGRDSPAWVANRRSLIAGGAIYACIAILGLVLAGVMYTGGKL